MQIKFQYNFLVLRSVKVQDLINARFGEIGTNKYKILSGGQTVGVPGFIGYWLE